MLKMQNNSTKCANILNNRSSSPTTVVPLSCLIFLRTLFYRLHWDARLSYFLWS